MLAEKKTTTDPEQANQNQEAPENHNEFKARLKEGYPGIVPEKSYLFINRPDPFGDFNSEIDTIHGKITYDENFNQFRPQQEKKIMDVHLKQINVKEFLFAKFGQDLGEKMIYLIYSGIRNNQLSVEAASIATYIFGVKTIFTSNNLVSGEPNTLKGIAKLIEKRLKKN